MKKPHPAFLGPGSAYIHAHIYLYTYIYIHQRYGPDPKGGFSAASVAIRIPVGFRIISNH